MNPPMENIFYYVFRKQKESKKKKNYKFANWQQK